jgi:hypothetical protein
MKRHASITYVAMIVAASHVVVAQPTAAATVLDARPRQIASLGRDCVPLSDPYVSDVKRICRVNVFRLMGTVNGKRLYFALYRRLVVLPQDDVPAGTDHSQAGSPVDKPPFVNSAVVIFEETEPDQARPIFAAANEGYLGNEWFNEPRSIERDGKELIVISRMVGSILEEDYYGYENGAWARAETPK